jgi:RHS repeat-associated protein
MRESDPALGGGNASPHAVTTVLEDDSPVGSYIYDNDGGLLNRTNSWGALNLTRDADGRITVVNSGAATYVYDEAGQRSRKRVSGGDEILYVDPTFEVEISDPDYPTHQVHYFYGSRRVATEKRSRIGLPGDPGTIESWQYYFSDYVGSNTVVVSNFGDVQKSFFRPFGEFAQSGDDLTDYLFTDQENDPESGLQYFGARYYDPWVGRFMSQDPELISAHTGVTFAAIAGDPRQNNAYSYALNAPTQYVDPSGRATTVFTYALVTQNGVEQFQDTRSSSGTSTVSLGAPKGGGPSGTSAAQAATGGSQNAQFSSGGTTITTTSGATATQQRAIDTAEAKVLGTARGQQMVEKLKSEDRSIEIRVNNAGKNSAPAPGDYINIDPSSVDMVLTKTGWIPATLERKIAHELGHAVFGDRDIGPGRLENTIRNETPIMKELHQPVRIKY